MTNGGSCVTFRFHALEEKWPVCSWLEKLELEAPLWGAQVGCDETASSSSSYVSLTTLLFHSSQPLGEFK